MSVRKIFLVLVIAIVSALGVAAQTDVSDLVGSRASNGENALRERGYVYVKGSKNGSYSYTNWWNSSNRACIVVATRSGRFDSINGTRAGDCNQNGGFNGGGNGGWNGGNDDYGNWNGNGSIGAPPSWARGRFYSRDGIELRIRGNGQIFVVNDGQTYYGRFYNNRIYLNGDTSTIAKTNNGFSTFNLNSRQTTYYSPDRNGGNGGWNGGNNDGNNGGRWNDNYGDWNGNGAMSAPPSWARGKFSSPDGIELRIRDNGQVFVVNGGQTFYGRFYNNRIYLNGDTSTIAKTNNGFSTYNLNLRQTTYYSKR